MNLIFASDLNLSPLTTFAIIISGAGFIVMFAIASAKGGFQELVNTTLENDLANRNKNKERQTK